jgi:hypothetical protein
MSLKKNFTMANALAYFILLSMTEKSQSICPFAGFFYNNLGPKA